MLGFRSVLAVALLAAFPLVVVGVGAGGVAAGVALGGRPGAQLALFGIGVLIALGFPLVSVLITRLAPPRGPRLTRQAQPELWRVVEELAELAGTRPPDEITLIGEVNAAVREDTRLLGLRPGTRHLMIGLPLLAGLTVAELRAVLAHELGHYGRGHSRFAAVAYRGSEALARTVDRLDRGPVRWVLGGYAGLYRLVSGAATRAQERQADEVMAATSGPAAAANALRAVATLGPAWAAFNRRYARLAITADRTPDLLLGFHAFLVHPAQRDWLAGLVEDVLDEQPESRFDSHPTLRRRLAALARAGDHDPEPDARPAWAVLTDPRTTVPALEGELIARELGPRASWAEIVRLAGAADARQGAGLLAKAVVDSGQGREGTVGEAVRALRRGRVEELAAPVAWDGATAEEVVAELLADTVVAALVQAGRAHHELNWGGPWVVRLFDGKVFHATLLTRPAAADRNRVESLGRNLTALGVPPGFVHRLDPEESTVDEEPALVGVFSSVKLGSAPKDLLVYGTGLLVLPLARGVWVRRGFAGLAGASERLERKRIARLTGQGHTALAAVPGALWLPLAEVAGGSFARKGAVGYLTVELTDRSPLRFAFSGLSEEHGDAHEGLSSYFRQKRQPEMRLATRSGERDTALRQ
ncbi:Zn-dependent protease with chaperone function [Crossiella equi]|uniref:Zn-dependent protease with chaperone function n=1 Tax=Crossiella equi TaxID=130796 RepID=A0ABS5AEQ9_9PSEU|nr:M48 family metallopeptidase [Crossiella equi]MBP2475069.1 Zn-dependent protease with chaperone function [Crossiella equi]